MSQLDIFMHDDDYEDGDLLLKAIYQKVQEYLAENPELLMSHLYRLDIEESKIQAVLQGLSHEDPAAGIAQLIYERQLERVATKKENKQPPIKGWEF